MRFEKHGGQWLIFNPSLPQDPDTAAQILAPTKQAIDRMTAIVRDTSLTSEERVAQLTSAMMSMAQSTPPDGDDGS
jgi:hypothetical protein